MDIRKETARRLRARRLELDLTVGQVSARMPSRPSDPRYNHWEKGERLPKMEQILELAEALNVSPAYICGFTPDMHDQIQNACQFSTFKKAAISLPTGEVVQLPSDHSVQFNMESLRARGLNPERLILLVADGNSMAPVLNEGDFALVDRDQRVPERKRDIFAMLVRNKVWFRWICPELDGSFTVTAEDGEQQRETRIEADALDKLCIIGRVTNISSYR
jgi:transcriptional regulator with XRE-family HTH domain